MRLIVSVQLAMPMSEGQMKRKTKSSCTDELRREYARSDFPNGFVRGKHAARVAAGSNTAAPCVQVSAASRPDTPTQ
jgi:hypothetical protein